MRSFVFIAVLLILGLTMVACSSETPGEDFQSVEEPESEVGEQAEYPGPQEAAPEVGEYPGPAELQPPTAFPEVTYPGYNDGDEVEWHKAVVMVMNGEVVQVVQTHDLKVSLKLRDGRTLLTIEPAIDEIITIMNNCGEKCQDVIVVTE